MAEQPAAEPPFAGESDIDQCRDFGSAQVTIVGLGLIGGSLGLALREKGLCRRVYGVARRVEQINEALLRGVIDAGSTDLALGIRDADWIVLAAPVCTILRLIPEVGALAKLGAVLWDVGSTKQEIVAAMEQLPSGVEAVGGHPMCGKEIAGLEAAESDLFQGATFVLTPLSRTSARALRCAEQVVEAIGARPIIIAAREHDRLAATISHLPYLLAAGLMAVAQKVAVGDGRVWSLAAGGFRDTSRVAASEIQMMSDILLTNREAVAEMGRMMKTELDEFLGLVACGDREALHDKLAPIQKQRGQMFRRTM
jgi:prephenate dehydrogenase